MTTTYDYGAPLKENGGVGEKYAAVKGLVRWSISSGDCLSEVGLSGSMCKEPIT